MSFVGITFDGQNVSPKDDGALYAAHYDDGIIDGCAMTIGGNNDSLVISSGHIIAGGRQCKVDGATELDLSDIANTTAYVQVYLQYDVSQAEGNQWDWGYNEQAALPFGALTQEDINGTGNIYQLELAILEASGGSLTAISRSLIPAPLVSQRFRYYDSDGDVAGQLFINDSGNVYLGGNTGGIIYLRPNGTGITTGQAYIDSNGYFRPTAVNGTTLSANISGSIKATLTYQRKGNVITGSITAGTGSAFSSFTSGVSLGTLASGFIPSYTQYFYISARTSGAWASATYYDAVLCINSNGDVQIYGNQTNIRTCTYMHGGFSYAVN